TWHFWVAQEATWRKYLAVGPSNAREYQLVAGGETPSVPGGGTPFRRSTTWSSEERVCPVVRLLADRSWLSRRFWSPRRESGSFSRSRSSFVQGKMYWSATSRGRKSGGLSAFLGCLSGNGTTPFQRPRGGGERK